MESTRSLEFQSLVNDAAESFPREYVDEKLEHYARTENAKSAARHFLQAMAHRENVKTRAIYLCGGDVASVWNMVAPDDCHVVSRDDFDEMRKYAVSAWKLLEEIIDVAKNRKEDPHGRILDMIRDAERFDADFGETQRNMPQVVENCQ